VFRKTGNYGPQYSRRPRFRSSTRMGLVCHSDTAGKYLDNTWTPIICRLQEKYVGKKCVDTHYLSATRTSGNNRGQAQAAARFCHALVPEIKYVRK